MSHVTLSVNEVQHQFVGEGFSLTSPHGLVRHAQHMFILARRKSRSRSLNCLPLSHKHTRPPPKQIPHCTDSDPQCTVVAHRETLRLWMLLSRAPCPTPCPEQPQRPPRIRPLGPCLACNRLIWHRSQSTRSCIVPESSSRHPVSAATHACATLDPASPPCTPLRAPTFAHTQPRRFRRNI